MISIRKALVLEYCRSREHEKRKLLGREMNLGEKQTFLLNDVSLFLDLGSVLVVNRNPESNQFGLVSFKFALIGFFDSSGIVVRKMVLDFLPGNRFLCVEQVSDKI